MDAAVEGVCEVTIHLINFDQKNVTGGQASSPSR